MKCGRLLFKLLESFAVADRKGLAVENSDLVLRDRCSDVKDVPALSRAHHCGDRRYQNPVTIVHSASRSATQGARPTYPQPLFPLDWPP